MQPTTSLLAKKKSLLAKPPKKQAAPCKQKPRPVETSEEEDDRLAKELNNSPHYAFPLHICADGAKLRVLVPDEFDVFNTSREFKILVSHIVYGKIGRLEYTLADGTVVSNPDREALMSEILEAMYVKIGQ